MIKQEICKQTNEKVLGRKIPTKITAALMAFLFFLTHKQKDTCGFRLLVHKDAKYCVPCCCSLADGWPGMMLLFLLLLVVSGLQPTLSIRGVNRGAFTSCWLAGNDRTWDRENCQLGESSACRTKTYICFFFCFLCLSPYWWWPSSKLTALTHGNVIFDIPEPQLLKNIARVGSFNIFTCILQLDQVHH